MARLRPCGKCNFDFRVRVCYNYPLSNRKNMNLKILTQKEFEGEIKSLQKQLQPITMIDTILEYCERKKIEVETAAALITPKMKATIESEAMKARLIPQKARLPLDDED